MSILINVNISKIEKNRFSNENAVISLSMSFQLNVNNNVENYNLSEQRYQFPLPAQNLDNNEYIAPSPALINPGDPNISEIEYGCNILAKYWLAQLGINESEINLNIIGV